MEKFCQILHPGTGLSAACISWYQQAVEHCNPLIEHSNLISKFWNNLLGAFFREQGPTNANFRIEFNPNELSERDCRSLVADFVVEENRRAQLNSDKAETYDLVWQWLYWLMGIMMTGLLIKFWYRKFGGMFRRPVAEVVVFAPKKRAPTNDQQTNNMEPVEQELQRMGVEDVVKPEELIKSDGSRALVLRYPTKSDFLKQIVTCQEQAMGRLKRHHELMGPKNAIMPDFKAETIRKASEFLNKKSRKLNVIIVCDDEPIREYSRKHTHRSPLRSSPIRQTPARQTPTRQSPVRQSPVRQSPVRKSPVRQSPVRQSPVRQSPVRQSPVRQSPVRQSPVRQSPVRKSPVRQSPVRQSPVCHSPVRQSPIRSPLKICTPALRSPRNSSPTKVQATSLRSPRNSSPTKVQATLLKSPRNSAPPQATSLKPPGDTPPRKVQATPPHEVQTSLKPPGETPPHEVQTSLKPPGNTPPHKIQATSLKPPGDTPPAKVQSSLLKPPGNTPSQKVQTSLKPPGDTPPAKVQSSLKPPGNTPSKLRPSGLKSPSTTQTKVRPSGLKWPRKTSPLIRPPPLKLSELSPSSTPHTSRPNASLAVSDLKSRPTPRLPSKIPRYTPSKLIPPTSMVLLPGQPEKKSCLLSPGSSTPNTVDTNTSPVQTPPRPSKIPRIYIPRNSTDTSKK